MNVYAEVELKSKAGTKHIIEQISRFCNYSINWLYDEERSKDYSDSLIDIKGCVAIYNGSKWNPGFVFCERKEGLVYLANIVPKESGQISIHECNELSKSFYEEFKTWVKKQRNGINIKISKTDLELEDIITAKIPRNTFQVFLNNHPLSNHPCDIERLDKFICSIVRYSRRQINFEYLAEYLRKKKNWPESNVEWCINRIEIGLDLIHAYKKY